MSQEKVLQIIADKLGLSKRPKLTDRLVADLEADSIDTVEIASKIEKEFGIRFSDEEKERVTDVASLVALVKKKTS